MIYVYGVSVFSHSWFHAGGLTARGWCGAIVRNSPFRPAHENVGFLRPIRKGFPEEAGVKKTLSNRTHRVKLKWLFSQRPEGRKTRVVVVATAGVNYRALKSL